MIAITSFLSTMYARGYLRITDGQPCSMICTCHYCSKRGPSLWFCFICKERRENLHIELCANLRLRKVQQQSKVLNRVEICSLKGVQGYFWHSVLLSAIRWKEHMFCNWGSCHKVKAFFRQSEARKETENSRGGMMDVRLSRERGGRLRWPLEFFNATMRSRILEEN